jgi:hypothetical protein
MSLLIVTLLLAQLSALAAGALPAQAATSADPSEEIVYVDGSGVIRVLDTQGDPLVQWFSPTGGWSQIALGDVNDDGDFEIVAIGKDGDFTRVGIFDPVVTSGATDPNRKINGIPWDTLYDVRFPGQAQFIYAGDYDTGVPGEEVLIGFRDGLNQTFVEIWNAETLAPNGKPTGRNWKVHIRKSFADLYEFATSGQMIEGGTEEVFLFDRDSLATRFDVFRPELDFERIDGKNSDNDAFRMAALGQIIAGGNEETAVAVSASRPDKASLIVYKTSNDNELQSDEDWAFAPQPEHVFLADISGNGDDEVFFLRKFPDGEEGPRLIMRDEWGDDRRRHPDIELALMDNGSKNEFRVGAGGDVDGDGKDEVIILSTNRIRIFTRPDQNVESSSSWVDYANLSTDRDNLRVGDLDKNGFIEGPVFALDKTKIEATVAAGTVSGEFTFAVSNISTAEAVGVNVALPIGLNWATVNPQVGTILPGQPALFRVRFDARNLSAGRYSAALILTSPQPVVNQPLTIDLELTVIPPKLQPEPGGLSIFFIPCDLSPCSPAEEAEQTGLITRTIRIGGSNDLVYQAAIVGVPDDVAAAASSEAIGEITGGAIDEAGNLVLYDAAGNSRTIGAEVRAAAALSTSWTIDASVDWVVSASSDSTDVPSTLTLVLDPTKTDATNRLRRAVLVLVADTRAGGPPDNIKIVPLEIIRAGGLQRIPLIP